MMFPGIARRACITGALILAATVGLASDRGGSLAVQALDDATLGELLFECRSAAIKFGGEGWVLGAQIVEETWDGTIGAAAVFYDIEALATTQERIVAVRAGKRFNATFTLFGLRDSFRGVIRSFRSAQCNFWNNGEMEVRVCDSSKRCKTSKTTHSAEIPDAEAVVSATMNLPINVLRAHLAASSIQPERALDVARSLVEYPGLSAHLSYSEQEAAERAILAHVRPIPASQREANALGYHALFILRPDLTDYAARAKRYGAKIQPSG